MVVIKAGPIERVEFAYNEREVCENFAWVVFKHASSVEDSVKLFCDTKLYGIPIITKSYSKHFQDPAFHEQLDYFKQLMNVERSNQSKEINKSRWNNSVIPDSLPKPPIQGAHNTNQDVYYRNSGSYKNTTSMYQHSNTYGKNRDSVRKNEHNFSDRVHHNRGNDQKPDHNSPSVSMEMSTSDQNLYRHQNYNKDPYCSPKYDRKHRDYNMHASYDRKESKNRNQEPLCINEEKSAKDEMPVRDLRDTMNRKRLLSYKNPIETNSNAACKPLDLRDTLHHRKNSRYDNSGQYYESDSNNRWSERNNRNTYGGFSDMEPRKNNSNSERNIETNTRHKNHNYDRNFNPGKSYGKLQEYEHEYQNNYNNSYNQDKSTPYNNKYNNTQSQYMESNSHEYNLHHPYKQNDEGHKKKEYTNSYDEQSEMNHGRSYNKKGTDQSRQNFY